MTTGPSSIGYLSDHETKVDFLNNEAIAKTILRLVRQRSGRPITIGVHGDWGAGKSSVLEMVEATLKEDGRTVCLKFNGWQFQGFEDAKIALIEGVVNGLRYPSIRLQRVFRLIPREGGQRDSGPRTTRGGT